MEATFSQIKKRYSSLNRIFDEMVKGREISLLDSREFEVSQMHTMVVYIRKRIEDKNLPYQMRGEWFTHNDRKMKRYWLEITTTE